MKPIKTPKEIHNFLLEKGFGFDKKFKYYNASIKGFIPIVTLSFFKQDKGIEVDMGLFYPNEHGINGSMINPEEVSSLLPNGMLFMTGIIEGISENLWDFSFKDNVIEKFNQLVPKWVNIIMNPKLMLELIEYLMGKKKSPPKEFDYLIGNIDLRRREVPNKFWHKSLYTILQGNFDLAKVELEKMPDWCLNGDAEKKVLNDIKDKKISNSDDLVKYLDDIGAKEIDLDKWLNEESI